LEASRSFRRRIATLMCNASTAASRVGHPSPPIGTPSAPSSVVMAETACA
jgi:hypothetical protein